MTVILVILLSVLIGAGIAGWLWWRKRKAGRPRVLRDTTHLGPFVNLSLLSDKGGMAKIHRATNSETKRDCVLKVLRSEMLGNPEVVKKFRREADILQSIKKCSPDAPVVQVYSTGTISTSFVELPYIEMEYIPGGTDLSDYIRSHQCIDPQIAATIVAQVVQALRCADGIAVHRDLKPGNIMLANGDPCQVIVCDFGVAKDMDSRSVSQSSYGTAAYMAPEQCVPDGRVTWATDVYALGVIWYRMLTGSLLFDDPNPLVVMRSHVEQDPKPELEAKVPEPYRQLLARMLAKNPAERPGFDELEKALPGVGRRSGCLPKLFDGSDEQTAILGRPGQPLPPVLKSAIPRGLRAVRPRYALAIGASALCLFAITWFAFHGTPSATLQVAPGAPVEVNKPPDQPLVPPAGGRWEVSSAPAGAEVRVDDHIAGRTPLTIALMPGEHRVRATLEGYEPYDSLANVQRPGQGGALHAALMPLPATLAFTSSPSGAEIVFDGAALGAAPVRMQSVRAGKYKVTASLEGFSPQERWILARGGQQATVAFNFQQERGWLSVHSVRAAADVVLDDTRLVGVTPIDRLPLPVGSYVLVARAPGFPKFRTTIEIQHGNEHLVDVALEPAAPSSGFLTVNVLPAGAVVLVDGARVGQTPLVEWRLARGDYRISVTAPGKRPLEKRLEVAAGKTEVVTGTLTAAASVVEIVSEPPGLEVHFDGVSRGNTPLTLADQPHGRHRIALIQGGRLRWQGEVTLDGSREREVVRAVVAEVEESRVVVNGSISVNVTIQGKPGWGTVMVNGKVVGNSPVLLKDLEPLEYRIRVKRPGFKHTETVVTLTSGERKLVIVDIVPE